MKSIYIREEVHSHLKGIAEEKGMKLWRFVENTLLNQFPLPKAEEATK